MEQIQAVPIEKNGQRSLRFSPEHRDPTMRFVELSNPAKTRASLAIGRTVYSFTVHYVKDPATLSNAK
jgi:hypothetical protein